MLLIAEVAECMHSVSAIFKTDKQQSFHISIGRAFHDTSVMRSQTYYEHCTCTAVAFLLCSVVA